ncbi:hypothetical protein HY639_02450 [Candidatus Woesearchaeota archaeon]|nr:hypothetical protein [Candidatus Woesearchaeota archaeon]
MTLYLIGTVHGDLHGPKTLVRLLERLRPTLMTVEAEVECVDGYPKIIEKLSNATQKLACGQMFMERYRLAYYELDTTLAYCTEKNIPLSGVDLREEERKTILWTDLLPIFRAPEKTQEKILTELCSDLIPESNTVDVLYGAFRHFMDDGKQAEEFQLVTKEDESRNRHMAKRISQLYRKPETLVHVGGLAHIFRGDKYDSLFTLLEKYDPVRISLRG